jgi:hypothetical protein
LVGWLSVVGRIGKYDADGVNERVGRDKLRVVDGIMVVVWEKKEDALSQELGVNVVLTNGFEKCSSCGTSVVASMVFPVVVVCLDEEPLAGRVVQGLNVSSSESVSRNNSSLIGFCSGENDVSEGTNWGILQILVSTVIGSTVLESISGDPGDLLVPNGHLPKIINKPKNVAIWPSLVLRK